MSNNSIEEKIFRALNLAYYTAISNKKKKNTAWQDADIFLQFAWRGSIPYHPQVWQPFPSKTEINHTLFHLKDKKSFFSKALLPRNWFEKKVANDFRYYKYYSETGTIESVYDGMTIKLLFDGRKLGQHESIKFHFLRVMISEKLFLQCFANIPFE